MFYPEAILLSNDLAFVKNKDIFHLRVPHGKTGCLANLENKVHILDSNFQLILVPSVPQCPDTCVPLDLLEVKMVFLPASQSITVIAVIAVAVRFVCVRVGKGTE